MNNMKIKDLKPGDAILVKTEEEDLKIRKMFHDAGFKWRSGSSLLKLTYFGSCKQHRTYAYELDGDDVGGVRLEDHGDYNLIPASEFFFSLPEKWAIKIDSQEVVDVVGEWLDRELKSSGHTTFKVPIVDSLFFIFPDISPWCVQSEIPLGYTRISLEEFKAAYPQEIKKGDWVYFKSNYPLSIWESVMRFDRKRDDGRVYGTESYTIYCNLSIEFQDSDHTDIEVRLATPDELSRIRDAYEDEVVKELRSHMKGVTLSDKSQGWNEALELAISIIKNTKKI